MSKYFSPDRIREACERLGVLDSKWVLVPFVMGCNGVSTQDAYVNLSDGVGTDRLLQIFTDADLLGLPKKRKWRTHHVRPFFIDLQRGRRPEQAGDVLVHGGGHIWGNNYTVRVNPRPGTFGLLRKPGATDGWRLSPDFQGLFERELPPSFRFDDLLVWLHAFSGFPDEIASWQGLWDHFRKEHLKGVDFPPEYQGRFAATRIQHPWPTDLLSWRPTNEDLVRELIPSEAPGALAEGPSAAAPLGREEWAAILASLSELADEHFVGLEERTAEIARQIVVGLATSKRVFILGDPGTGKTELAKLVEAAFREVVGERLHAVTAEVTDKTGETTLTGFIGLDGKWVHGKITAPDEDGALLTPRERRGGDRQADGDGENLARVPAAPVNLIRLNEANRRDAEALLSLFQASLDSESRDPNDPDHEIRLGMSGPHLLSPDTYVVMTGNSPRDDMGRVPQSRPFRRRIALVWLPNPLAELLEPGADDAFVPACLQLWEKCSEAAMGENPIQFGAVLSSPDGVAALVDLRRVLQVVQTHRAGVSFGLLRKVLLAAEADMSLTARPIAESLDIAVLSGVSAILAAAPAVNDRAPRDAIAEALRDSQLLPRTREWAAGTLGGITAFGTVDPTF